MSKNLLAVFLNLAAAAIGALLVWSWQRLRSWRRLRALREAAKSDEIAVCVRVGGMADPVPDVLRYLREHHPEIQRLVVYRVSAEEATLDDPATAQRVIEDIREGMRASGKEEETRVHFFPSGMVVYPLALGAMLNHWGSAVVYHKPKGRYVALYEMNKDWIYQRKRGFQALKAWEVIQVGTGSSAIASPPAATLPAAEQEPSQQKAQP